MGRRGRYLGDSALFLATGCAASVYIPTIIVIINIIIINIVTTAIIIVSLFC